MGIRKYLKATLGLLAVGGVAFAGASKADEIHVKQIAHSGDAKYQTSATDDSKYQHHGGDNSFVIQQEGQNVNIFGHQTGGHNRVGDNDTTGNSPKLDMQATDGSGHYYDITATIKQNGYDKIVGFGSNDILIKADAGSINFTTTQAQASSGSENMIQIRTLHAESKDSSGNAIDVTLTQDNHGNGIYLGSATDTITAGVIKMKVHQSSSDNTFQLNEADVKGTLTVKGVGGDTFEQGTSSKTAGHNVFAIDKLDATGTGANATVEGSQGEYNFADLGSISDSGGDITITIDQVGDSTKTMAAYTDASGNAMSNYVELQGSSASGGTTITITQSDSENVVEMENNNIEAGTTITFSVTQDNNNKLNIDTLDSDTSSVDFTVNMDNDAATDNEIYGVNTSASDADGLATTYDSSGLYVKANSSISETINVYGHDNHLGLYQKSANSNIVSSIDIGTSSANVNGNTVAIYQEANGSAQVTVGSTSANVYADVDVTANGNDIYVMQKAGQNSGNGYADLQLSVASADNDISITQIADGNAVAHVDVQ